MLYSGCVLFSVKEILKTLEWGDKKVKQGGSQLPVGDASVRKKQLWELVKDKIYKTSTITMDPVNSC